MTIPNDYTYRYVCYAMLQRQKSDNLYSLKHISTFYSQSFMNVQNMYPMCINWAYILVCRNHETLFFSTEDFERSKNSLERWRQKKRWMKSHAMRAIQVIPPYIFFDHCFMTYVIKQDFFLSKPFKTVL